MTFLGTFLESEYSWNAYVCLKSMSGLLKLYVVSDCCDGASDIVYCSPCAGVSVHGQKWGAMRSVLSSRHTFSLDCFRHTARSAMLSVGLFGIHLCQYGLLHRVSAERLYVCLSQSWGLKLLP